MSSRKIDPIDIRKFVKENKLKFYVDGYNIYCIELPFNGERFIVGTVEKAEEAEQWHFIHQ